MISKFLHQCLPASVLAAVLFAAGCGGGGDGVPPTNAAPTISVFSADRGEYFVGDTARLTVRYSGGAGRIEPGVGPVADGSVIEMPALEAQRGLRLVVEGAGGRAVRDIAVSVRFRDRYVELPVTLRSVGHEAVVLQDGAVLLIGGSRGEGVLSHRITRFDPGTRTLAEVGLLQIGRAGHRATRLADGRVLVTGGETSLQQPRRIELIDPYTGQSLAAGELATKRIAHAATLLADGRVLLTGGYSSANGIEQTAEIWDPATRSATLLPARMNSARAAHSATRLADGRVLIFGGAALSLDGYVAGEVFDPRTGAFTPVTGDGLGMRLLHGAHLQPDGSVLIMGGEQFDPRTGVTTPQSSVLRFDAADLRIVSMGTLGEARSAVALEAMPGGGILLFGGLDAEGLATATAEAYSATAGGPRALAPLPTGRAWHTVTRLADGRILIAGGEHRGRDFVPNVLLYE